MKLIFLSVALAQTPTVITDAAGTIVDLAEVLAAEAATDALPQYVWTTEAVSLTRWQGDDTTAASVDAGSKIQVVLEDGDMIRVRSGTDFGWISRDKLTTQEPTAP